MARANRPIRAGVMPGFVPNYPIFTLEEASVICRRPGSKPDYGAGWRMVKLGVKVKGRTVKLKASHAVGGTVIRSEDMREFLRRINSVSRTRPRAAVTIKGEPTERLRRGAMGCYELPASRQVSLQRAEAKLSSNKAESSGRARHGKGRTGVALPQ